MDTFIYHRVFSSAVLLSLLSAYTIITMLAVWKHVPLHPELKIFHDLGPRYNTVWNMIFLMIYSSLSLICDISTIMKNENLVPLYIRNFRNKVFHAVMFPQIVGMFIFWPIFFYDRELVFPTVADILLSPFGNFVFHGLGIVYVCWELIFLPYEVKKSDVTIRYLLGLQMGYLVVVLYTRFIDMKVWVYEVLAATEGTILFPIVFFSISTLSMIGFHSQWYFKDCFSSLKAEKVD